MALVIWFVRALLLLFYWSSAQYFFFLLYYTLLSLFLFQKGNDGNSNELGYNIVGLIPGQFYNTSKDRILFVGAHWDTYGLSPGFDDNGSGVAAVLEAARVLAAASCYRVSEIEEWNNNSKKNWCMVWQWGYITYHYEYW